jgi:hypothetical protein
MCRLQLTSTDFNLSGPQSGPHHVDVFLGQVLDVVVLEGALGQAAHLQLVEDQPDVVVRRLDQRLRAVACPSTDGRLENFGGLKKEKKMGWFSSSKRKKTVRRWLVKT